MIEAYMTEQPEKTPATFEAIRASDVLAPMAAALAQAETVLLVGSGSSFNALTIIRGWLQTGIKGQVETINPMVLMRDIDSVRGRPFVLVLSQSGTSSTSIEIARICQTKGWPVGVITAGVDSPITALDLPSLFLPIGDEPIGPKTKGFTASIAACFELAAAATGQILPALAGAEIAATLEASQKATAALLSDVPNYIAISGSGRHFGVALEGSLKIAEIAGVPTAGFEPEELLHGRLHGVDGRSLVIMIAADKAERELAAHTAKVMGERGVKVALLNLTGEATEHDWLLLDAAKLQPLDSILASLPFQRLAVDLAVRRGMDPSAMTYPGLSAALAIKTFSR
jgi:fructoselysine-6-P-deglycase FrlB-like protein